MFGKLVDMFLSTAIVVARNHADLCLFGMSHFVDRKSTRLNSSHRCTSYAVFCLKKKNSIKLSLHSYTTEFADHQRQAPTQLLEREDRRTPATPQADHVPRHPADDNHVCRHIQTR